MHCSFVPKGTVDGVPLGSTLPPAVRSRLVDLFGQIVQEFEVLYAENEALHQQLGVQSDRLQGLSEASAMGRWIFEALLRKEVLRAILIVFHIS